MCEVIICGWCIKDHWPPGDEVKPCTTRGCECWCREALADWKGDTP
jgi:hypothetical protein